MTKRRDAEIVTTFTDEYEEERTIIRDPKGRMMVKRRSVTPIMAINSIIAKKLGERIKYFRKNNKLTMAKLGHMVGLSGSSRQVKVRIHAIESCLDGGVRLGTLFCLANALNVDYGDLLPPIEEVKEIYDTIRTNGEVEAINGEKYEIIKTQY